MSPPLRMLALSAVGLALSACSDDATNGGAGTAVPASLDVPAPGNEPVSRSYEVAIATAAADQVRGLEACLMRPKVEQADCRKQTNEAYERARSAALVIRGTDR